MTEINSTQKVGLESFFSGFVMLSFVRTPTLPNLRIPLYTRLNVGTPYLPSAIYKNPRRNAENTAAQNVRAERYQKYNKTKNTTSRRSNNAVAFISAGIRKYGHRSRSVLKSHKSTFSKINLFFDPVNQMPAFSIAGVI